MTNIEKSAFRRGEYVGYANGVWRVRKVEPVRRFGWVATHRDDKDRISIYGRTLRDLDSKLAFLSHHTTWPACLSA